jgi:hypothetical protein
MALPPKYYILNPQNEPLEVDLRVWTQWFQTSNRQVDVTRIGEIKISTVFLGLDHNYTKSGPPLVFETLVFGGEHDGYCRRASTWKTAQFEHDFVCINIMNEERDREASNIKAQADDAAHEYDEALKSKEIYDAVGVAKD